MYFAALVVRHSELSTPADATARDVSSGAVIMCLLKMSAKIGAHNSIVIQADSKNNSYIRDT